MMIDRAPFLLLLDQLDQCFAYTHSLFMTSGTGQAKRGGEHAIAIIGGGQNELSEAEQFHQ
jgi:hypothetical protein